MMSLSIQLPPRNVIPELNLPQPLDVGLTDEQLFSCKEDELQI